MAKLDTDYGTFKDLVAWSRIYSVPLYQRRYAWRAKFEVAALWADIGRVYRERLTQPNATPHFIGSLVIGETKSRALGPGETYVIDGQQRLTTLSLIVAAIRDVLVEDPDAKRAITEEYLTFPSGELRLQLSQTDRPTYEGIVRGEPQEDSRDLLTLAYEFVVGHLRRPVPTDPESDEPDSALDEDLGDDLEADSEDEPSDRMGLGEPWSWSDLLGTVAQGLELVTIADVPAERAYQIFATLNHAGLALTQVDLIRNAVFMRLPTQNAVAYERYWQPLEQRLGERQLERFLHAWVIRNGENVPRKETYSRALRLLGRAGSGEASVLAAIEALLGESRAFELLSDPNSFESNKIAKKHGLSEATFNRLKFLATWGNVPAQPLLLEIVSRRMAAKGLSEATAASAVGLVESFLVRRFLASIPPNDLRSTIARVVIAVRSAPNVGLVKAIAAELAEESKRYPSDDEVVEALVTKPFYRGAASGPRFLILRRLAERLEGKEHGRIELGNASTKYSVEHVLPQSLEGTTWLQDMQVWGDPNPIGTWNTRRHTIGNLTLTAYNSELSNKPFDEKKAWIEEHLRLRLSTQILDSEVWTKPEIEKRSEALAKVAFEIWPAL